MPVPYYLRKEKDCVSLLSPAKINLFLAVTGKREDGYHDLFSLMCPISLYDEIFLRFGEDRIGVSCNHPEVPEDNRNIAFKAAELFFDRLGRREGVLIRIDKRIPAGAGLGGGSSNAASVLLALNDYYGCPFPEDELAETGLRLGADVPFFIFGRPAIATGIGEKLEPFCGLKPYKVVLIFPGFGVSTAEVYKNLNLGLTNCQKKLKNSHFRQSDFDPAQMLCNDLETVTEAVYPEISAAKKALTTADGVLMSGSGSTVFGLFSDAAECEKVYASLSEHSRWQCYLADLIV